MSLFDKALIALMDIDSKNIDFTDVTGFSGCYTQDPDHPSYTDEFFILFNENIHNNHTEDVHTRFRNSKKLKRCYTKRIKNVPYCVYSFWPSSDISKIFKDKMICLNFEQKKIIQNFWSEFDKDTDIILNSTIISVPSEDMPLEDYIPSYWEQFNN